MHVYDIEWGFKGSCQQGIYVNWLAVVLGHSFIILSVMHYFVCNIPFKILLFMTMQYQIKNTCALF